MRSRNYHQCSWWFHEGFIDASIVKTPHCLQWFVRRVFKAIFDATTEENKEISMKKSKVTHFFGPLEDNSTRAVVARLTAKDCLSFKVLTTSDDIRMAMRSRNIDLPKSPNTIREYMNDYAMFVQRRIAEFLKERYAKSELFSLTLDEWTSMRNRRYMNINVHTFDHQTFNLGIIRIIGSMSSETCKQLVITRLSQFRLDLETDIVACTTDGASVMQKFGKLISCDLQLCYCHGIHLAVCDVMYLKKKCDDNVVDTDAVNNFEDVEMEVDVAVTSHEFFSIFDQDQDVHLTEDLHFVVHKVRSIVRSFKKSPVKLDLLQKYIIKDFGKELHLILDTKTRWNSLVDMLSRFMKIVNSIKKAMIDLNMTKNIITDHEIEVISMVCKALKPLQLVVEQLSSRNINILMASTAVDFALKVKKVLFLITSILKNERF
jgi:hypothetical protein